MSCVLLTACFKACDTRGTSRCSVFEVPQVFDLRFSLLCCFCHFALEVQLQTPMRESKSFLTPAVIPGGVAAAGYVSAVSALVTPWVNPGLQGQLSGPHGRFQCWWTLWKWLLWRGWRIFPGFKYNSYWAARWERYLSPKWSSQG